MPDPQSPDEWMVLARCKEAVARAMVEDRRNCAEAFTAAGFAVEYALKALIMRTERLNGWPSRELRPDLHQHAVRSLAQAAGVDLTVGNRIAASWLTVLQWQRSQDYDPKPMKRVQARAMVEAAFGPDGVVTWIRSTLT